MLACLLSLSASGEVRLHEFMASNRATIADEDGDFEDWIELHNPGAEPVDLTDWGLSDDPDTPFRWRFAPGTVLEPGGFLLVWASGKDRPGSLQDSAPPEPPEQMEGLVLWLRASSVAEQAGEPVAAWADESGEDNHATQPDSSQRPTLATNAFGGHPAIQFNRAQNQQVFLPTAHFAGMEDFSAFSLFQVIRWTGGVRSGLWGGFRGNNTDNIGSSVLEIVSASGGQGNLRLRLPPQIDFTANGAVTQNEWHVVNATMDATAGQARLRVDGGQVAQAGGTVGRTLFADYERVPLGSSHDDSRTFGGQIAEVLLFNRGLSAEETEAVEAYLEAKYRSGPATSPHTNFRIAAGGEPLQLTRPDGSVADFVPPVALPTDVSYGRRADDPETWAYFYEPTPGAPNDTPPFTFLLGTVTFSTPSGFFSSPFELSLTYPDPEAVILFTTDGSEPHPDALGGSTYFFMNDYWSQTLEPRVIETGIYQNPLAITDRSQESNGISTIRTSASGSHFPQSPVKKGTVVRARVMVNDVLGPERAASYFVSNTNAFNYSLPIVSLSVDEEAFFGWEDGIYVPGRDRTESRGIPICDFGNYNRRGPEAERAVHLHYFESGELILDQGGGARIQGNCSRQRAFKSMRLYARGASDVEQFFTHDFFNHPQTGSPFPDNHNLRRLTLRTPNFNDTVFSRLFHPVNESVGWRIQPVIQFINGEYWGVTMLRDRFDADHLAQRFGLNRDEVAIIGIRYRHEIEGGGISFGNRVYHLSEGIPEDMDDYTAMRAFVSTADMNDPGVMAQVEAQLCLDSFIDHLIVKIFAGDDHYAPEYVFWRVRTPENDGLGDGRWRVHVKDFDSTLFTANYVQGLATGTHPRSFGYEMFANLLTHEAFRHRFINRFADLLNTHFRTERFDQIIHDTFAEVSPYWAETQARWNNVELSNPNGPFTTGRRDQLLNWSAQHPARQRDHIRSHFGIAADRDLTLDVSDSALGHLRVNSMDIHSETPGVPESAYPWTGIYFDGIPVTLTAVPAAGRRFEGWRYDGQTEIFSPDPVLTLTLNGNTSLEAVFAEDGLPEFLKAVAGQPRTFAMGNWFDTGEGGTLTFSAGSSRESVLEASVSGQTLTLAPLQAGDAVVSVSASDGVNPPQEATFRVLVYPAPHVLAGGNFFFGDWSADAPAGAFPPHMIFLQSEVNDPGLDAPLLHPYRIAGDAHANDDSAFPYAATSRTRINGLGASGISFINTGRGRDLGSALLSLDTRGVTDLAVTWTAQTLLPNIRVYAIRLQARDGLHGAWQDVLVDGSPVEYLREASAGPEVVIGPVTLGSEWEELEHVQLQWRYYHVSGNSGARAQLRLDDITVTSSGATPTAAALAISGLPAALSSDDLPAITVQVLDQDGLPYSGYNGAVTLSVQGGAALATVTAVDGVAVFDGLNLGEIGAVTLVAEAQGLLSAQAETRRLRLVSLLMPAHLQGEQNAEGDNLNRIPVAFRFRIEGLDPGAAYRYGNRMIFDPDDPGAEDNGAGNFILIPAGGGGWVLSRNAPRFRPGDLNSRHAQLTADANGEWEGWVVTEPSGNERFTPGNALRPLLILNNGAGGEASAWFLRAENTVTALELGTDPGQGSALYGQTDNPDARFVAVYHDDTLLALTHVEARGSAFDDRYADFYLDTVAAHPGRWGTLIPNIPGSGEIRLEFLDAAGSVLETVEATVQTGGGTLALWLPATSDYIFLPGGNGRWNDPNHWAAPGWPEGAGVEAVLPAPLWDNREILLPADLNVTLGELVFTNGPHRNRIAGAGALTFDGTSPRITVTDAGPGWAEFDLDHAVTLASTLVLDTTAVESDPFDPEFGALRLRGAWQGPGGLIKTGPGVASLTGENKSFTGELAVAEGVLRITEPATPAQVSAARVEAGGQLRLVSTGENREYNLGVPLQLEGSGRDPASVPEGGQLGILGALRFDPFANDNGAVLPGGVILSGNDPVSIHIDGTRNLLEIGGAVAGPASLSKTGGGTLRLSGGSVTGLSAEVYNGALRVDGDYPELSVSLHADGALSGTGTLKNASGAGTVVLGPVEILTAESVSGLSYRFYLQNGAPPPRLRLRNDPPFGGGFNAANQFALYLDSPPSAHPRFGFFSEASADLAVITESGAWSVYVRDEHSEEETYTLLTNAPDLFTSRQEGGTMLGAAIGPASFADWAAANDLPEGEDGPADNPFGTGPHLLNFALGLPAGIPPTLEDLQLGVTGNGHLFARFRQARGAGGVVVLVEITEDLTNWDGAEILYDSSGEPSAAPDFDRMLIVDEAPEGSTRFLRLRVILAPVE